MNQASFFGPRGVRASALIAAALVMLAIAAVLYVRPASAPTTTLGGAAPVPQLGSQYTVDYDFVDPTYGWAAVASRDNPQTFWIFATTDGAEHWRLQLNGSVGLPGLTSLRFLDRRNGFATLDRVYRTTDGGAHWNVISIPDDSPDWYFASPMRGWAVDRGTVFTTADGGLTWQTCGKTPSEYAFFGSPGFGSIEFRATGEGWMGVTADTPTVYSTRDGGAHWRSFVLPPYVKPPITGGKPYFFETAVHVFPSGVVALASDDFGNAQAYVSFDGGGSWRAFQTPSRSPDLHLSFVDDRRWWLSYPGVLYRSGDAGQTWNALISSFPSSVTNWSMGAPEMVDLKDGWATMTSPPAPNASTGLVMTSDGGLHWHTVNVPQPA